MALAWAAPDLLRAQIVRAASRQFEPGRRAALVARPRRRRRAHAFLRRPAVAAARLPAPPAHQRRQLAAGRTGALHRRPADARRCRGPVRHADRQPPTASVYEHAARAIDRSLRVGVHGLPLMGSGDWNDGMNRVGHGGRGESVWLAWFLCQLVAGFAPLAAPAATPNAPHAGNGPSAGWQAALQGPAWDGRLVPPRLLRRRPGAGVGRQRRGPHRPDRAGLGGAVGGGARGTAAAGDGLGGGLLVDHDPG
jgi:cyclic beta-1,2-glucan synthetase